MSTDRRYTVQYRPTVRNRFRPDRLKLVDEPWAVIRDGEAVARAYSHEQAVRLAMALNEAPEEQEQSDNEQ